MNTKIIYGSVGKIGPGDIRVHYNDGYDGWAELQWCTGVGDVKQVQIPGWVAEALGPAPAFRKPPESTTRPTFVNTFKAPLVAGAHPRMRRLVPDTRNAVDVVTQIAVEADGQRWGFVERWENEGYHNERRADLGWIKLSPEPVILAGQWSP